MTARTDPQSLLPLTPPVFQILLALSDQERHGYAIMREVSAQTGGQLLLGPGTLYGCLKRLARGLLKSPKNGPIRSWTMNAADTIASPISVAASHVRGPAPGSRRRGGRPKKLLPQIRPAFAGVRH